VEARPRRIKNVTGRKKEERTMITFKQFLNEEDETDKIHDSIEDAARDFIENCSQFPDVAKPLYRLSGNISDDPQHKLKTRVPRTRLSRSRAGSAEEQAYVFSQPSWAEYPKRMQSIFCSTTKEFEVGQPDEEGNNLLLIYPFDGVKIALLDDEDLNRMNIFKNVSGDHDGITIDQLFEVVDDAFRFFQGTEFYDNLPSRIGGPPEKIQIIKKVFSHNGRFNSEANGDDELADKYADEKRSSSYVADLIEIVATQIPEKLTPKDWGAKLVTSSGLDLPGTQRECWFSGKYLSVPSRYYEQFKAEVKKLQDSK
jgi:hypothetical protein